MAHTLDVVYGATTINFGANLMAYGLRSLSLEETLENAQATLSESAEVLFTSTAAMQAVQAAFAQARLRKRKAFGDRVYLQLTPQGLSNIYRSEILNGALDLSEEALGYEWVNSKWHGFPSWTRRAFWEGPEAELSLSNGSGSGTGGRTIYNHDDAGGGHDNWVDILAASVGGVLPAAMRIELTNSHNDPDRAEHVFVGLNHESAPSTFAHILEAESAATIVAGATTAHASASNGNYVATTVAAGAESTYFKFDLTTAMLNAAKGNKFRVLARFYSAPPSDCQARIKVYTSVTPLWEGEQVDISSANGIIDLGTVRLPPYLVGTGTIYPLELYVLYEKAAGGTVSLDFLQLTPLDGWRSLESRGYGASYNVRVVDDGLDDLVYSDGWSPAGKFGNYVGYGNRIMLWPGKDQRLYFLSNKLSAISDIAQTWSVRVYYRPRILTL